MCIYNVSGSWVVEGEAELTSVGYIAELNSSILILYLLSIKIFQCAMFISVLYSINSMLLVHARLDQS